MTKLDINLRDPRVQKFVDPTHSPLASGKKARERVQLAGDPENPGANGVMSTHRLDHNKIEVLVGYRGRSGDFDLTVDVYRIPGEPITIHLICPTCHKNLRISGDRKKIEFDEGGARPYRFATGEDYPTNGGRLDVEPFECTWELPDAGKHTPGLVTGGMTLCRTKIAIDNSIAKDA